MPWRFFCVFQRPWWLVSPVVTVSWCIVQICPKNGIIWGGLRLGLSRHTLESWRRNKYHLLYVPPSSGEYIISINFTEAIFALWFVLLILPSGQVEMCIVMNSQDWFVTHIMTLKYSLKISTKSADSLISRAHTAPCIRMGGMKDNFIFFNENW